MPPEGEGQPNLEENIEPVEVSLEQSPTEESKGNPERELSLEEIEIEIENQQEEYGKIKKVELTPELISDVLLKVQDINKDGIAYSSTPIRNFESIFKEGFLGTDDNPHPQQKDERKREWAINARKRDIRKNRIWFNITGRDYLGDRCYKDAIYASHGSVTVLFNLQTFQELSSDAHGGWEKYSELYQKKFGTIPKPKLQTFARYGSSNMSIGPLEVLNVEKNRNERGKEQSSSDTGFTAAFRVNPRLFTGLVIDLKDSEVDTGNLADVMLNCGKPERVLPIYDKLGNLLWPVEMSHKKIKAMIAVSETESQLEQGDEKKLWEDKLRVAAKMGTIHAISYFQIPDNIGEIIPEVLEDEEVQKQLAKIALYELLLNRKNSDREINKRCSNYQNFIKQFHVDQESVIELITQEKDNVAKNLTNILETSLNGYLDKNCHTLRSIRTVGGFNETLSRDLFCSESVIECLYLSISDLEDIESIHFFLKEVAFVSDDDIKELTHKPSFVSFIHNQFIPQYGHKPGITKWLKDDYGIEKTELSEKCLGKVFYALVRQCFDNNAIYYSKDECQELYSTELLQTETHQKNFLNYLKRI